MGKIRKALRTASVALLWAVIFLAGFFNLTSTFDRYFDVGKVWVSSEVARDGFEFTATGRALRHFNGSYRVLLRDFATGVVVRQYPDSGTFGYKPTLSDEGEIVSGYPNPVSFDWWVGQPGELKPLPRGLVYIQTCWTVHDRLGGLFPPVSGCVDSNPFAVD